MAIYRNDVVTIDLENGNIHRSFMAKTIGEGDALANRFGVKLVRGGEAVDISGATCTGYFIRPTGDTVVINGSISNGTAYVELPQTCYAYEGQFSLAIKLTGGSATGTMRIVDGVVANTTTDSVVDPGTVIPSVEALIAAIDAAVATIPADYEGLFKAVDVSNLEGLAAERGYYINNSGAKAENNNLRCSDYVPIPYTANGIRMYVLYNASTVISPAAALYDADKNFLETITGTNHVDGVIEKSLNREARFIRFNVSKSASADDGHRLVEFLYADTVRAMDLIGTETLSATSTYKTSAHGWIRLKQGVPYKICAKLPEAILRYRFMLYSISGEEVVTTYYTDMVKYNNAIVIVPPQDSYLVLYNVDTLSAISVTVQIYEYKEYPYTDMQREYYVSKRQRFQDKACFSSLTECLLALQNDENPKTIYIEGGDYDIWQEYQDANVPIPTDPDTANYYNYCVWVPKNTHIIGRGIVKLIWNPPTGSLDLLQSKDVSPLNVAATATIENVEVHCKNGRYCLHNDGGNLGQFIGAVQKYINVKFYKYTNDAYDANNNFGFLQTIGYGLSARMQHIYEGCEFWNENNNSNPFYGHTRTHSGSVELQEADSAMIVLRNCILRGEYGNTMRLDNTANDSLHVHMNIESCYLEHNIKVNENDHQNAYDITILNCNDFSVNGITTRSQARRFPPAEG